jgi:CubicO group peptidase (beta-lactamase class C family)
MMGDGVRFSPGFMKHCPVRPFGNEGSFGSPGTGGSLGFADPQAGIGYAYVTSRVGTAVTGDPRQLALRNAVYSAVQEFGVTSGRRAAGRVDIPGRYRG